jgi:glycerate 2-kinase
MTPTAGPRGSGTGGAAHLRVEAVEIFEAAIRAVDPAELVAQCLSSHGAPEHIRPPTLVVGAGKAAARMAAGCEAALGPANLRGEVIVADGCGVPLRAIHVSEAAHPLPDVRGEQATLRIIEALRNFGTGDLICLISGGASSLMVCPRAPVSLEDKIATTRLLLECGADIHAFNIVRKHLSRVKGGGLLRHTRTRMLALLISDVTGDDPSTIGSGPTAPDDTTFADAWTVFTRYNLTDRAPASAVELLQAGISGRVPETVKSNTAEAALCRNVIIGSNRTALEGAAAAARARGRAVYVDNRPLSGDTTTAAQQFAARVLQLIADRRSDTPLCILAGGETTVHVVGGGRGGRNQEFALAMAPALAGTSITVLSAGTDGIDGPTDAAGAFVDGTTLRRAKENALDVDAALRMNDSYTFFSHLGDLFRCGPTATNVMDIKIALVPAGGAAAS